MLLNRHRVAYTFGDGAAKKMESAWAHFQVHADQYEVNEHTIEARIQILLVHHLSTKIIELLNLSNNS